MFQTVPGWRLMRQKYRWPVPNAASRLGIGRAHDLVVEILFGDAIVLLEGLDLLRGVAQDVREHLVVVLAHLGGDADVDRGAGEMPVIPRDGDGAGSLPAIEGGGELTG